MTLVTQCAYYEVCKHFRGEEYNECKIKHICKEYLSRDVQERDPEASTKTKRAYRRKPGARIGRPPKKPMENVKGAGDEI